ncbi:RNA polymerase sigma factor [Rhodococcus sp. UFZ-B548]|uniref:RNA polymerase sigma factor n=1 Tax=Rhodococcus sp. UFZ-B548 TaxID=2742212 RepID=UPI0015F5664E|nr:hypothetical protein [Rhodococcus sp. UFZ-B548]
MADEADLFADVIEAVDTSFSKGARRWYWTAAHIVGHGAADDVVHDAYAKLLASAADARAQDRRTDLAALRDNLAQPGFLYRVLTHQALDHLRRTKYERSVVADFGGALAGPHIDGPDVRFVQDDEDDRTTTGLAVVLDALVARAARPDTTIGISNEQLDLLRMFYRFESYAGHPEIDPDPSDAELDERENTRDRTNEVARRREQSHKKAKDKGRDPNYGMNARVAAHTGLRPDAISRSIGRVNDVIGLTLYLAGVLGTDGTLRSTTQIDAHLSVFETWLSDRDRHPAVKSLRLGARAVGSRTNFGTRVVPDTYVELYRKATKQAPAPEGATLIDFLHNTEERYSDEPPVANPYPRCVRVCTPHNPLHLDRTRILEF